MTDTLALIYEEYCTDPLFDSFRKQGFNFVPGEGPLRPTFMFVGEAPGAMEDELERPFAGASGSLLNELLASVGLSRDEVFVTNSFHYRPSLQNRDPLTSELTNSMPYLRREIVVVDPKVLVTLGRVPLSAVNARLQLKYHHGVESKLSNGLILVPTYHPAWGLRGTTNRETLFRDFVTLKRFVRVAP